MKKQFQARLIYFLIFIIISGFLLPTVNGVQAIEPLNKEPESENLILESDSSENLKIRLINNTRNVLKVDIKAHPENVIDVEEPSDLFIYEKKEKTITIQLHSKREANFNTSLDILSSADTGSSNWGWKNVGSTKFVLKGTVISPDDPKPPSFHSPVNGSANSPGMITQENKIILTGKGSAGTNINIYQGKSKITSTTVDWNGNWRTTLNPPTEPKKIEATTEYQEKESNKNLYGYVVKDLETPSITIDKPQKNTETKKKHIKIKGEVTDDFSNPENLKINLKSTSYPKSGKSLNLNPDGSFSKVIPLVSGSNNISIIAKDQAGSIENTSITIISHSSIEGTRLNYTILTILIAIILLTIIITLKKVKEGSRRSEERLGGL